MKSHKKLCMAAALGLFLLSLAAAQRPRSWSELGLPPRISPALEGNAKGYLFMFGGRLDGEATASFRRDAASGRWSLFVGSPIYEKTSVSDEKGDLVSCSMVNRAKLLADTLGMDSQEIAVSEGKIVMRFLRGGKVARESSIALDRPILDLDILPVLLPALVKSPAAKDFNSDILLKSKGWRINVDFSYFAPGSKAIAQEIPKLPARFREELKAYPSYHCFKCHPTGVIGIFGGDFYLLFADDEDKNFIGYWGGSGKEMEGLILEPRR
jgi:hypothetical protein